MSHATSRMFPWGEGGVYHDPAKMQQFVADLRTQIPQKRGQLVLLEERREGGGVKNMMENIMAPIAEPRWSSRIETFLHLGRLGEGEIREVGREIILPTGGKYVSTDTQHQITTTEKDLMLNPYYLSAEFEPEIHLGTAEVFKWFSEYPLRSRLVGGQELFFRLTHKLSFPFEEFQADIKKVAEDLRAGVWKKHLEGDRLWVAEYTHDLLLALGEELPG